MWLNRFDTLVPIAYAAGLFVLGDALARWAPHLGTSGWQLLIWGYVVSTVVLIHATLLVNSLAHVWGTRDFETRDDSRNNLLLAGVFWNLSMYYLVQGGMTNGSRWRRTGKCTTLHRQDR